MYRLTTLVSGINENVSTANHYTRDTLARTHTPHTPSNKHTHTHTRELTIVSFTVLYKTFAIADTYGRTFGVSPPRVYAFGILMSMCIGIV